MRGEDGLTDRFKNTGKQMRTVWEIDHELDVWAIPTTPVREKTQGRHPTQKPLALLERIVRASSNPGDMILDPFLGSGTTAVAAINNGRRVIGVDSSAEFLNEIAIPRIDAASEVRSEKQLSP